MNLACDICGNRQGNKTHIAREMMFGLRDEFHYVECAFCGCLRNLTVPGDLGKYYGEKYYSVTPVVRKRRQIYDSLKGLRTRAYLGDRSAAGGFLLRNFGKPNLPAWILHAGVRQNDSILEIGCGSGTLLSSLRSEGFKKLIGADPFIARDICYGDGVRILKAAISEIAGSYDFIVLEHAFEHIPAPQSTLLNLLALLKPTGTLIISIPLVAYAWHHYGVNWVQLDAPRHLYLHSETSFRILAKDLIVDVVYDSGAVQFWGSEQYKQDIPLISHKSYRVHPDESLFSPQEIAKFEKRAIELNAKKLGDQATFFLRKNDRSFR